MKGKQRSGGYQKKVHPGLRDCALSARAENTEFEARRLSTHDRKDKVKSRSRFIHTQDVKGPRSSYCHHANHGVQAGRHLVPGPDLM